MFDKFLVLLVFLSSFTFCQKTENKSYEKIINVNFCDLLRNPAEYKDKIVRIKATYRVGFEWTELYCSDCLNNGRTWVGFDNLTIEKTEKNLAKELEQRKTYEGRTANVIFIGKHKTGKNFGHLGEYQNLFEVESVEGGKVIYNDSPVPQYLPEEVKAKTYC